MNLSQMSLPDCGNLRSTKRKDVKQCIFFRYILPKLAKVIAASREEGHVKNIH